MGNSIKYSEGSESLSLNKGNWWIGTGDTNKGPTAESGYWNAINPPSGGYTVYLNKESNGPSIHSISNDEQLISFTNKISGNNYVNVAECLVYYQTQDDKLCVNREYENIVTDGLVLNLDAGYVPSYPTSGTTWYDLSGGGNDGTLINGPIYSGGSIVFDGSNDRVQTNFTALGFDVPWTFGCWFSTTATHNTNVGIITLSYFPNLMIAPSGVVFLWNSIGTAPNTGFSYPTLPSTNTYNDGNWHYIIGSYNTGGLVKLYVDGKLINSANYTPNGVRAIYNGVDLGTEKNNGFKYFNGKITSGCVYNRELSAQEVLQNYNATKTRFGL